MTNEHQTPIKTKTKPTRFVYKLYVLGTLHNGTNGAKAYGFGESSIEPVQKTADEWREIVVAAAKRQFAQVDDFAVIETESTEKVSAIHPWQNEASFEFYKEAMQATLKTDQDRQIVQFDD